MKVTQLAVGLASYVPGFTKLYRPQTGGTCSARYCYSVWLRHLVIAHSTGLATFPHTVAELGPGDSLGTGLAALLSGVDRYYAFDVVKYAGQQRNLDIFDELVELFALRADIPDQDELPLVRPTLASYDFPAHILDRRKLQTSLSKERVAQLRRAVMNMDTDDSPIRYAAPWFDASNIRTGTVDMLFSQAVLEHVDQLDSSYAAMRKWLSPTGFMTHTIDYKSHGLATTWSGHWAYSDMAWTLLRGMRPYLLNRQPHSAHLEKLRVAGFKVLLDEKYRSDGGVDRASLARRFSHLTDDDLVTSESFIVAVPS